MAKPTIAQLRNELETLRAHADFLETRVATLTGERDFCAADRDRLAIICEKLAPKPVVRPVYVRDPADVLRSEQFRAKLAAARALAIATGKSVRVG